MIGCDHCDNWFHPKCLEKLGINIANIKNIADFPFSCKNCTKKQKLEAERKAREKVKATKNYPKDKLKSGKENEGENESDAGSNESRKRFVKASSKITQKHTKGDPTMYTQSAEIKSSTPQPHSVSSLKVKNLKSAPKNDGTEIVPEKVKPELDSEDRLTNSDEPYETR